MVYDEKNNKRFLQTLRQANPNIFVCLSKFER
jgi:hypothetical protein